MDVSTLSINMSSGISYEHIIMYYNSALIQKGIRYFSGKSLKTAQITKERFRNAEEWAVDEINNCLESHLSYFMLCALKTESVLLY